MSIIVNFFPFCGLEECAMHIDNPQMRGLFFCGVTRHRRGYDRLRLQRSLCGGAAGIKRQLMSISFVNYCQFFPFCGLEECAMHIDNPQMRGCSFAALLGKYAEGTTDCDCKDHYAAEPRGYFIETIEKTDIRLGISVKKRNISIYGITSTCATHQPKAMNDNALAIHLRCGMLPHPRVWTYHAK